VLTSRALKPAATDGISWPSYACSSLNTSKLHTCIFTVADDSTSTLYRFLGEHASLSGDPVLGQAGPRPRALDRDRRRPLPGPFVALVEGDLTRTRSNPPALAVWNAPRVTGKSVEVVKPGTNQFPLPSSQEPAPTLPSPPLPPR
jgi:hypothetical protein